MVELLTPEDLAALGAQSLTYAEVGATAGPLPGGYAHQQLAAPVGHGVEQFAAAAEFLLGWRMQERAGLRPLVSERQVQEGSTAVLRLGLGRLALRIPVRVVRLVDEPTRRGFAYGTLPGHPERGEESFLVELAPDGTVFFRLVAFSRAGRWYTALAGPVARRGQALATERYLDAVREAAQSVPDHA